MKLNILALIFLFIILYIPDVLAYRDNYPPYRFKDGPSAHLNAKPLIFGEGDYKSESVVVHLTESKPFEVEFFIKAGNTVLVSTDKNMEWFPSSVFQADLNNDGRDDFIVIYNSRAPGFGGHHDRVEIYLQKQNDNFEKISYYTFDAGIEDFIGPDKTDKCKVIITGFYQGDRHSYFTYNIYEFKNYRLVNADAKVKGFPKFVWYTDKPNDEDAAQLTKKERSLLAREKNGSIHYKDTH